MNQHFPDLLIEYQKLYKNGNDSKDYNTELQNRIMGLRKKYQLFSSYKPTEATKNKEIQMSLFD